MKTSTRTLMLIMAAALVASSCGSKDDPNKKVIQQGDGPSQAENKKTWGDGDLLGTRYAYIANNEVQIGVDLERGGGIFHFSTRAKKKNLLNHADEGRFIQQSYYGNDGNTYWWTTNAWTWNPIQGGGSDGQSAVIKKKKIDKDTIKVVSTPMQWGRTTKDGPCELANDCEMTEIITLKENYAILDFTFKYNGDKDLGSRSQEVPALFCDWDCGHYVRYAGNSPWTDDKLTDIVPQVLGGVANPNPASKQSEEWCAYVNSSQFGIGLYTPGTDTAVYYIAGPGPGGPMSGSCSYFAPIRSLHIKPGFVLNYKAYLTIGTTTQIRATFKKIHDELAKQ